MPTTFCVHVELSKTCSMYHSGSSFHLLHQANIYYMAEQQCAWTVLNLAIKLNIHSLPTLTNRFLFTQLNPGDPQINMPTHWQLEIPIASESCPQFEGHINVINSASSRFFAPSDLSRIGGMQTEYIRAMPLWRNEGPRWDCVFVNTQWANKSQDPHGLTQDRSHPGIFLICLPWG